MKYELTDETKKAGFTTLHRIKALKDFGNVKAGELGGWIESEKNLSQDRNAWVSDDAWVYGDAEVTGNALVSGNAWVSDDDMQRDQLEELRRDKERLDWLLKDGDSFWLLGTRDEIDEAMKEEA